LVILSLLLLAGCATSDAQSVKSGGGAKTVPVTVAAAKQQTVPILIQTTGTVQAYSTVAVKSQVDGQLTAVHFTEGKLVQQGEPLFNIDARPLQAALDQAIANRSKAVAQVTQARAALTQAEAQVAQAQANVKRDLAQARNANAQSQRYSTLRQQGAVSQEQADQYQTSAESQQATVAADQSNVNNTIAAVASARADLQAAQAAVSAADAAVDSARVQLSYARINSPITGRTGSLKVNAGNLVKANDTNPLVQIDQVNPIYVAFSIPQRQLPQLQTYRAQGRLRVEVTPDKGKTEQGEVVFVDSGVDATTGTIQVKASFANTDEALTPGQFVKVVLHLTDQPNAIVVPSQAVQTGQNGSFVYVVKPDKTVEARQVETGATVNSLTMIQKGLQSGETVVTDGQFNLTPGAKVQEKTSGNGGGQPGGQDAANGSNPGKP
jgi:multidrug efflux system membrane fusion protein